MITLPFWTTGNELSRNTPSPGLALRLETLFFRTSKTFVPLGTVTIRGAVSGGFAGTVAETGWTRFVSAGSCCVWANEAEANNRMGVAKLNTRVIQGVSVR